MLTYDLTARGRKTMYEYLYEAMKADILSGRLAAGEASFEAGVCRALTGQCQDGGKYLRAAAVGRLYPVGGEERIFCQSSGGEEHSCSGVCFLCDPLP